ncbi:MAG: hypothetical protein M0P50_11755, partial [Bacteroidales bacterium]|nr:hypothetical protein [Bacteroidales bacterium]
TAAALLQQKWLTWEACWLSGLLVFDSPTNVLNSVKKQSRFNNKSLLKYQSGRISEKSLFALIRRS